jgi:MoaA/NifB/PqqE/SkfB family radical SAM enzyme
MYKFQDIKILQLEISNYCNASCPQCPRNYFGGKTLPTLPLRKWTLTEFKEMITVELLSQLKQVYFCGTYGDPMTNKDIIEMCKFLKDSNSEIQIGIHTNGGVGSTYHYQELAKYTDFIAFGIDGLENTNHIYRRNVKWKKIIANAESYINSGGHAIWDFIVFKHNEDQIDLAKQISVDMGFKEFNIKKTSRFLDRNHEYKDHLSVYHQTGYVDYTISLPTNLNYVNKNYSIIKLYNNLNNYAQETTISCNACRISEVYIGADGFVFPCGWLHDRLYGPDIESHTDYLKIKQLMVKAGGWQRTNIFYTRLKDIVNGSWFNEINDSWTNDNRLERCGIMCGSSINFIKDQNEDISYKL